MATSLDGIVTGLNDLSFDKNRVNESQSSDRAVGGELGKGGKVQLVGFGTFEVTERAARVGKNPQNGKEISIPACKAPKFKAGKALKDAVNE